MSVVVLTSGPGSPGTTTTALGLTLTWPRDVLLADCDREPAQTIQAGYLRGIDHGGRGLVALSRLHRENRALAPELLHHGVPLSRDEEVHRRFLPGFSVPGAVRLFDAVWTELADAFASLGAQGMDVVVDAGSVGRDGLPLPLLARADAVCFVTRTSLRSLAAARLHLPTLAAQLASLSIDKPLGLALVGPGMPYSAREIQAQFTVPCWSELDWSPRLAEVLSDGTPEPRLFHRQPLLNQYQATGLTITHRIARANAQAHEVEVTPHVQPV